MDSAPSVPRVTHSAQSSREAISRFNSKVTSSTRSLMISSLSSSRRFAVKIPYLYSRLWHSTSTLSINISTSRLSTKLVTKCMTMSPPRWVMPPWCCTESLHWSACSSSSTSANFSTTIAKPNKTPRSRLSPMRRLMRAKANKRKSMKKPRRTKDTKIWLVLALLLLQYSDCGVSVQRIIDRLL